MSPCNNNYNFICNRMKKRIGNDFLFYWVIKENGVLVNPGSVHDFKIEVKHEFSGSKTSPQFDIVNGSARVRCEAFEKLGLYQLIATWRVVDTTFADGFRDCAADVESFEIVGRSAQADNENPEITSEVAIGFEGLDAYDVWVQNGNEGKTYEDYIAFPQKPATDAAQAMVSNIIALEIRDDMSLYFITPETYSGITFELQNGNLIATI